MSAHQLRRLATPGAPTAARSKTAKKVVTYGTGRFKIAPGSSKTVKAKLSKRGKKLIRGRKTVRVYAMRAVP